MVRAALAGRFFLVLPCLRQEQRRQRTFQPRCSKALSRIKMMVATTLLSMAAAALAVFPSWIRLPVGMCSLEEPPLRVASRLLRPKDNGAEPARV